MSLQPMNFRYICDMKDVMPGTLPWGHYPRDIPWGHNPGDITPGTLPQGHYPGRRKEQLHEWILTSQVQLEKENVKCQNRMYLSSLNSSFNPSKSHLVVIFKLSLRKSQVAHQAGAYLQFLRDEATRSISTPPWMGCQSITGLPPALNSPVPIYTPGWRKALWEWSVLPKNRMLTISLRSGLKPRLLNLELSALTMRPPLLPLCLFKARHFNRTLG